MTTSSECRSMCCVLVACAALRVRDCVCSYVCVCVLWVCDACCCRYLQAELDFRASEIKRAQQQVHAAPVLPCLAFNPSLHFDM